MASSDTFDQEILRQINKKQALEAMSGIYQNLPVDIIEAVYDFCNDPRFKDYNEYIFLHSKYEELSANDLKKYYKLHNKLIKQFQNLPHNTKYKRDQVLEDSIGVIPNRDVQINPVEFIPEQPQLTTIE